jgi:hypothetical protein
VIAFQDDLVLDRGYTTSWMPVQGGFAGLIEVRWGNTTSDLFDNRCGGRSVGVDWSIDSSTIGESDALGDGDHADLGRPSPC